MKKTFLFAALAAFTLLATSCGDTAAVIGTSIRLGNLEVAQNDFPKLMTWNEAKHACADLGAGWRLPTIEELNLLYGNKEKIGGFANEYYWSSTENNNDRAWMQNFTNGGKGYALNDNRYYVRAVQ